MHTAQPQARDGADLQVGDTVRYENTFRGQPDETTVGIIIRIRNYTNTNTYLVFSRGPHGNILTPVLSEKRIIERINTDYRGMSGNYILSLHSASYLAD